MTNKEIINELAKFMHNETLEECPINITSREHIAGENAELVRFTFGPDAHSCVAVAYNEGTVYTPFDWQANDWDESDWKVSDTTRWMDCNFRECFIFNEMPRMLF